MPSSPPYPATQETNSFDLYTALGRQANSQMTSKHCLMANGNLVCSYCPLTYTPALGLQVEFSSIIPRHPLILFSPNLRFFSILHIFTLQGGEVSGTRELLNYMHAGFPAGHAGRPCSILTCHKLAGKQRTDNSPPLAVRQILSTKRLPHALCLIPMPQ